MKRRKLVALVAVIVFAFLGLLVVSAVLFVTRTQRGRDWVRDLARHVNGAPMRRMVHA